MIDPNLVAFVWSAVTSGVIGSATYDSIKFILGKGFDRLASYAKENKESEFKIALLSILETNEKMVQELSHLRNGTTNIQQQNHQGIGDNIVIINQISTPFEKDVKYQENLSRRNALRDFIANDVQFIGSAIAGALHNINISGTPAIAKELDKAIQQADTLKTMFIANRQAKEVIAQVKRLGMLAWDNKITIDDVKKFCQCKDELESILIHLDEILIE